MQGPPAQLAEVARFCQEEGAAGKEKILLHYLKRIAVLNPLLRAVTEVASFQQLRNAGTSQEDHGGPECGPGNVSTARGGSSNQEGSAELFEEGRAESSSKESSLERRSDRPGKSAKLALAINADRELHSVLLFERRKHHNSDWTLPPSQHPKPQSTRPLEGVPFLVKDVIDVAGFRTVAGCELLARTHPADASADIVRQLQALGAVPVGKSTVPEACSQSRVDVQTFSSLHSVTENPYKFSITSGGSSGGSAVAVATGMVPLAVGTDWAGSLRIPAAFCGICTLRASRGRMTIQYPERTVPPMPLPSEDPRDGEIMTAGVFTRTIRELQYAVGALLRPSRRGPLVPSESAAFAVTPSFPVVATDVRIQEALQRLPARVNPPNGNGSCSARLVTGPSFKTKDIWKAYGIFSASLTAHGDPHDPHAPKASPPSLEDVRWARSVQVDTASAVDAFLDEQQCTAWIVPVCGPLPVFPNPEHKRFHPIGHTKTAY